ncbi:fumarylacetoacetate hydrolase family protein [Actinoallomurus iriomotensis]|uniref:2-hydroxyhepta-2,4-diene-1,7-dioate isomerase n=1 Tax=Actinoallomurus iriomotensis TaxID=478107 RepID=A0A9W6W6F1_9ACTN|nr:fumarylacetoacetate hydrolase family protein [Actinoallomurus iriomotensis]GLY90996.1 2-hydroxyhepta-2,4-diene-1,7-dioate isomerase [Actinoallomurus iriomotensis]
MRIARVGGPGREVPVVLDGDRILDLRGVTADVTPEFLEHVLPTVTRSDLPELQGAGELRFGPPITRPTAVICIGMNYAKHAAESGAEPPTEPVVFLKHPNTVVGPDDPVPIPRGSTMTDWEVELGVVIGRRALYLDSPADSPRHIAGYVLANDVSERELQLRTSGGQWSKGKCAPSFTPLGPWLVTPDELDPGAVRLRSHVNGGARQDSRTSDLIFSVAEVVHRLSQFMALEAGDLILTGTPEGVALSGRFPYLRPGDVVELEGEGLGAQRQEMVSAEGTTV